MAAEDGSEEILLDEKAPEEELIVEEDKVPSSQQDSSKGSDLLLAIASTLLGLPKTPDTHASSRIILSHFFSRSGDKAWGFIIPLILSAVSPTLLPASLFALITTGSRVIFGNKVGKFIDENNRLRVVFWGVAIQAVSIACSGLLLWILLQLSSEDDDVRSNLFHNTYSAATFLFLLLSASIGALAAMVMDISVEKDWVPTVITKEENLTFANARMRQVDLATEVGGPFIAGILLVVFGRTPAFLLIAIYNFLTFFPQFSLLYTAYRRFDVLAHKAPPPEPETSDEDDSLLKQFICGGWNPAVGLYNGWNLFIQQPIWMVVISMSFLWLTILSPHDPVLTAYLMLAGYSEWELGLFRGVGAIFGVLSALAFPALAKRTGVQRACMICISIEGVALVLAGLAFIFFDRTAEISWIYYPSQIAFLGLIVLSRCGLYSFEVGEIQILQQGIPENVRGQVNSVEGSLTSLASLVFFIPPIFFSDPKFFIYLVWGSVFFINAGVVTYAIWCSKWRMHSHSHRHAEFEQEEDPKKMEEELLNGHEAEPHDDHSNLHSTAQVEGISDDGTHTHVHFHLRRRQIGSAA